MRCGVAQSVARVGNAVPGLRCHGIGYLLARSSLYASFAVTCPSDVILVSHILFFLSIFSLNNRANSSHNAATPLSVNTE